jgi:hypothetical protein
MRGLVAELRRKSPEHPKLAELESALSSHDASLRRHREEWAALLQKIRGGGEIPDDIDRRLRDDAPELRAELRNDLRSVLVEREASLLEEANALTQGGPSPEWTTPDAKARARTVRARLQGLIRAGAGFRDGIDTQALTAATARLDALLAYLGTWTLRINLSPFAEFRIRKDGADLARDFTPSRSESLEIRPGETTLELGWPSLAEPRRRWSGPLPALSAGDTLVVSGDLEHPDLNVEHR